MASPSLPSSKNLANTSFFLECDFEPYKAPHPVRYAPYDATLEVGRIANPPGFALSEEALEGIVFGATLPSNLRELSQPPECETFSLSAPQAESSSSQRTCWQISKTAAFHAMPPSLPEISVCLFTVFLSFCLMISRPDSWMTTNSLCRNFTWGLWLAIFCLRTLGRGEHISVVFGRETEEEQTRRLGKAKIGIACAFRAVLGAAIFAVVLFVYQ